MLGCRLGARSRTLPLEPRLSWCKILLSLSNDTFINLGLGVLNMVLFSRHRALKKVKMRNRHTIYNVNCILYSSNANMIVLEISNKINAIIARPIIAFISNARLKTTRHKIKTGLVSVVIIGLYSKTVWGTM